MMLDADVQAAIVVDRTGRRARAIMTVERVIGLMREGEHGQTFGVDGERSRGPDRPTASARGEAEAVMEGKPFIDWDWIFAPPRRRRARTLGSTSC